MSTQKIGATPPANRLLTGYEGQNVPEDFNIPPVGIEDVDRAMFNLFETQVPLYVTVKDDEGTAITKKVPTIFAIGERHAIRQRKTPVRDEDGQFILPMISVTRVKLSTEKMFMGGRGMGIDTGDLVIKTRLSPRDRRYQNIINKIGLKNQANVASLDNLDDRTNKKDANPGTVASRRETIDKQNDYLLEQNTKQNIVEVITMPFPEFFVASYEVVVWTQFEQQMNEVTERIWTNYNPNQNSFKLVTPKGYWFVAHFEDEIIPENNKDDFTSDERMIKQVWKADVPAYMIAPRNPGDPSPFRSFVSAPQISFGIYASDDDIITDAKTSSNPTGDIDKFMLSDITPLDIQGNPQRGRAPQSFKSEVIVDRISGKKSIRYVKIKSKNTRVGETVIGADYIDDVDVVLK